jgi:hypothetical protein
MMRVVWSLAYGRARCALLIACAALVAAVPANASPLPSATPAAEKPTRTIALVLNGDTLATDTPPQVVEGRLLIPLRPIFEALGIPIIRNGRTLTVHVPLGEVVLTIGSDAATLNAKPVSLGARVVEFEGATYVPLRALKVALGANAGYDQRGARVEIVSAFIGRTAAAEEHRADGGTTVNGVATAIDTNSQPPSLTVSQGGDATRTIAVNSDALIFVEDVTVHSQIKATLADVHAGDQISILLASNGRVLEIHAFYSSDNGTISAVSPTAIVLQNGRVVQPARNTDILLNAATARLADLAVGDYVTVRRNPTTGEIRQIIASRAVSATATAQPSNVDAKITTFDATVTRPLHAGESFDVTMQGTPGGRASFDIGDYLTGLDMREETPGTYRGHFIVPDRFNVAQVPLYGHLGVGSAQAPRAEASEVLSAATTPPQITEVAPSNGQTVNNPRPSIYANYLTPAQIPINVSSVMLLVNGQNVTASATRTGGFIAFTPGADYPDGEVKVTVKVADAAGNSVSRSWTFVIKTH